MFSGFTQETADFLWELSFNNERAWFLAHKEQFERCLNGPFRELAADTARLMAQRYPQHEFRLHVARIYKDARRLHGSGPYKEHLWFSLIGPEAEYDTLGFWFEVGAADYSFGVGSFRSSPAQMEAFRRCIDAEPARFERIASKLAGSEFKNFGDEYRRPKGDLGELINRWYNRKNVGVECRRDFGGALLSAELPEMLTAEFGKLLPLYDYIVGAFALSGEEKK